MYRNVCRVEVAEIDTGILGACIMSARIDV